MNFDELKQGVERHEALVAARARQTLEARDALRTAWHEGWTPVRIVGAGLLAGFVTGRAQPELALARLGALLGPQTMQMASSASGMLASLQAAFAGLAAVDAAGAAERAAGSASEVAEAVAGGTTDIAGDDAGDGADAPLPPSARRRRPDPSWDAPPRAAEAATDVSERR